MVENHGSRKRVSLLLNQANEAFQEVKEEEFISCAAEGKEEIDELLKKVHYQQLIEEAQELVEVYLYERKYEA